MEAGGEDVNGLKIESVYSTNEIPLEDSLLEESFSPDSSSSPQSDECSCNSDAEDDDDNDSGIASSGNHDDESGGGNLYDDLSQENILSTLFSLPEMYTNSLSNCSTRLLHKPRNSSSDPIEIDYEADLATEATSSQNNSTSSNSKKRVKFHSVVVYYFSRRQGFTCIPSQGGSTLGMSLKHSIKETFPIDEYDRHFRQLRRRILIEQHLLADSHEFEIDDSLFLQPVPFKKRRLLLIAAGVKKIELVEKQECAEIRTSREQCGCNCRVVCDPATCLCALHGIKCQVDRPAFPCGCSKEHCRNPAGRIEFNAVRVRTHFLATLLRIERDCVSDLTGTRGECLNQCCSGGNNSRAPTYPSPNDKFFYHANSNPCADTDGALPPISQFSLYTQSNELDGPPPPKVARWDSVEEVV